MPKALGYATGTSATFESQSGVVDRSKAVSKTKKGIGYSADTNSLLLDIQKDTSETTVQSSDIKALNIKNTGKVPAFIILGYRFWTAAATQGSESYHVNYLLKPNEELYLPTIRGVISDEQVEPLGGTAVTDGVPDANMYTDSTADVDHATSATMGSDATHTTLNLEDGHSKFFRVGDLIRLENEICEVTATGTGADLANSTLTIIRGTHGSTAATHADDVAVRFAFFNAYHDFDKYSVAQTDSQGRFKCFNMFGAGRAATALQGIVPGSFSVQFYEAGYQELGLTGITSSTNSGLTAGGTYKLDITVDGGSLFQDLTFTLDSSNVNFGGKNGVVSKIQEAFDTQFYTAGNLFEKKVHVAIVGGDIRFTSGSHLATSAILLADTGDSDTFIDAAANGRIPASGSLDAPVAAKLAPTETYDPVTYGSSFKEDLFVYDDGNGNLFGKARGTINYETGAIDMVGCPPNAQFVYNVLHTSAFSGKQDATEATKQNSLQAVYANLPSQKWAGEIEIETF
tara:strand:- start:4854 stop:6395 length:1542 start_codon:yes stop_codon:yes gene_type:complete